MPGTVKSELLPDADRSHKCDCQEKVCSLFNLPLDKGHFITEFKENEIDKLAVDIEPLNIHFVGGFPSWVNE